MENLLNQISSEQLNKFVEVVLESKKKAFDLNEFLLNFACAYDFEILQDKIDTKYMNALMSTMKMPINLDKVYLKKSNIHGFGVFAKQDIKKNEMITLYPCHYVLYYPNGNDGTGKKVTIISMKTNEIFDDITEDIKNYYSFDIRNNYQICGNPKQGSWQDQRRIEERELCSRASKAGYPSRSPARTNGVLNEIKPEFLGHMINDGAKGHSSTCDTSKKDYDLYHIISIMKSNSKFVDIKKKNMVISVIATRDISKDEEILVTYGYKYWMSYNDEHIK